MLIAGQVSELWNDRGDTLVHLYPRSSGRGPSFRVDSTLFSDSTYLRELRNQAAPAYVSPSAGYQTPSTLQAQFQNLSLHAPGPVPNGDYRGAPAPTRLSTNFSVPVAGMLDERHIYLPLEFLKDLSQPGSIPQGDDQELVVLYRNFFAFLSGGALIATHRQPSLFPVFMGICTVLKRLSFGNADGSTWGVVPTSSFARYCQELRLADCRSSREKTIEAIVLGENMRSWSLYNEGFVHAAGRLNDIKYIKSPKYSKISPITINRLERASLEMEQRLLTVHTKLSDFDFPSMFSGIANSQTSTEGKLVRFKAWKAAFLDFRRMTMSYYSRKYGSWPPKAKSKKNSFEESGLNRLALKGLYKDFTDLYDMLADKQNMTSRTVDMTPMTDDLGDNDVNESIQHALRRVESEYDRASPPVAPPIPFDVPLIPGFKNSFNRTHVLASKSSSAGKRLKETEVNEILLGSYNRENISSSPWIQDFFAYERKLGTGKTIDEMMDFRCGQWLFMYAILQSLPMTVVDARDIKFSDGVEYFMCIPPRGGRPWMKEDTAQSRAWYNVASGGGVVSLPADLIDHSVEGIYRRSHCWEAATKWSQGALGEAPFEDVPPMPALQPPHYIGEASPHLSPVPSPRGSPRGSPVGSPLLRPVSANSGRLSRIPDRSSLNIGLEATAAPTERPRPVSNYNPNITFDAILGTQDQGKGKKGKK